MGRPRRGSDHGHPLIPALAGRCLRWPIDTPVDQSTWFSPQLPGAIRRLIVERAAMEPLPIQEVSPVHRSMSFAPDQSGQTTAEYALVLLVAALIVGVFATFANSGALTQMFEQIVSSLVERAAG